MATLHFLLMEVPSISRTFLPPPSILQCCSWGTGVPHEWHEGRIRHLQQEGEIGRNSTFPFINGTLVWIQLEGISKYHAIRLLELVINTFCLGTDSHLCCSVKFVFFCF